VLRTCRYDTVLRVTRYGAIRAPGLTILLSLPNNHIMTYCMMLGYTTLPMDVHPSCGLWQLPAWPIAFFVIVSGLRHVQDPVEIRY
jgi:hypothetical protein